MWYAVHSDNYRESHAGAGQKYQHSVINKQSKGING